MQTGRSLVTQEFIQSQLPEGFVRKAVEAVRSATEEVRRQCTDDFGPEGDDLRGHLLRALVERNLRILLGPLPGVKTQFAGNSIGNCKHLQITVGRLVITASAVDTRWTMVRQADFRLTLAAASQTDLFEPTDEVDDGRSLYLLIVHGPCGARQSLGFVDLVPPTRDCLAYVEHARIRMLDLLAEAEPPIPVHPEIIVPAAPELLAGAEQEEGRA